MNWMVGTSDGRYRFSELAELENRATEFFEMHKQFERDLDKPVSTHLWVVVRQLQRMHVADGWQQVDNYSRLVEVFRMLVRDSLQSNDARRYGWDQWGYWAITGVTPQQFRHWFDYCVASFDDWVERTNEINNALRRDPIQMKTGWTFDPEDADSDDVEDAPL